MCVCESECVYERERGILVVMGEVGGDEEFDKRETENRPDRLLPSSAKS